MNEIIFLVGLTAVGKTSSVNALRANDYKLLPNRRELTDLIIIPELQKEMGLPIEPVRDRLKRFEMTAKYRSRHPGGIVAALQQYLTSLPKANYIFDNIRGKNELKAAYESIKNARFVFLDAPFEIRLQRLIKRKDDFDTVRGSAAGELLEELKSVDKAAEIFNLQELAKSDFEKNSLLNAVRIIASEYKNYDSKAAKEYLMTLEKRKYIYLDTSKNTVEQVSEKIERFLHGQDS